MRLALSAAGMTLALASLAQAETKSFDVSGFTSVKASAGVDVVVDVGGNFAVSLETQGDIDQAYVEVKGDTLVLGRERQKGMRWGGDRDSRFLYTVSMPSLNGGESSSGADLTINGIDADNLTLATSSGADLKASGSCVNLDAQSSSGSDLKAFDVTCQSVTAKASSGSDLETTATQEINARASSGADIVVRGGPEKRNTKESSGGDVRIRD